MALTDGSKITVDANKLIESIGTDHARTILDIFSIDLASVEPTLSEEREWQCSVEKVWWKIQGKQLDITDLYAVRWTYAVEAGICDIEIIDAWMPNKMRSI